MNSLHVAASRGLNLPRRKQKNFSEEEEMPDQDYEKTEQFRQMLEQMRTGLEAEKTDSDFRNGFVGWIWWLPCAEMNMVVV